MPLQNQHDADPQADLVELTADNGLRISFSKDQLTGMPEVKVLYV